MKRINKTEEYMLYYDQFLALQEQGRLKEGSIYHILDLPDGLDLVEGKWTVKKAEQDAKGNIIHETYVKRSDLDYQVVDSLPADKTAGKMIYLKNDGFNLSNLKISNGNEYTSFIPTKTSDLENDTHFATEGYVEQNGGKIDKILLNNEEQAIVDKAVNLTINKTTVGLSNVDNTSDLNKPISTQTQTALDGLNQTITNNFNNLNSSIENETERATLAETEISTKLQQEMNTRVQEHSEIQGKIDTINSKIPNQASSTNQLVDKDFVNSTINSSAAFFKGSFKSKAALDAVQWQTTDSSLATYVSNNDYAYIEADETHNNEAWRYIYVKDNTVSEWQPQFRVNESPFTQAQLDAINSGATADLINSINSKLTQDAIVDNTGDSSIKAISQRAATLGINTVQNNLNTHISNTQNPHNVTKTQVGLSNVDNTSDIDKPISTAVQSALDLMLPKSEAPTKVSDLENDAAYIKNNDRLSIVQIPYIYNVQRIYSVEDDNQLYGNPDGQTHIALSSDSVSIDRQYPNTTTYIRVFASERDGVRDVTSIQSASTKRLIINGVEEPAFPSNSGVLRVVSEDDGSYIEANLGKLTAVQGEDGSNTLHQDSKSLIFNWNGLYLNDNEISPNTIRYDIEQTLTDEQKAQARANIGAGTGGGTVVTVGGVAQETWDADTKLDKSFIKTFGDTKITVDMNSDNTAGIVASYENSGTITEYIVSTMNLEFKEIQQYISGAKADGTPVYSGMNIEENGIQMYVTTDTMGGSGVVLTPDKIEIETPKLTYNGSEVATTLYVDNLTNDKANKKDVVLLTKEGTQNITSNIAISGDLNINGNIIQQGSAYETHAESVYTKTDYIITRDGAVSGLGNGEYTGIIAKLYDGTNDGRLVFDNNGVARVGDAGDEQPLATREETPIANGFAKWNSDNNKFITKLLEVSDLTDSNTLAKTGDVNKLLEEKVDKVDGKALSTNDFTNDYKSQVENNTTARHTHNNKTLLDTYTQTETNLEDAVAKKHTHNNKAILDGTTASYTTDNALSVTFAESERQKSKNLFPYSTITGTEFYQQHLNTPIKAGTYTISALVSSSDTDSDLSSIVFEDEDKIYPETVNLSRNNRSSTTFTINHDCSYVTFFASNSYTNSIGDTFTISDIQIEEGSVATDYQPYNGAIVHEKEIQDVEHIETIYDMSSSNGSINWGKTSGIPLYNELNIVHDFSEFKKYDFIYEPNTRSDNWYGSARTITVYDAIAGDGVFTYFDCVSPSSCYTENLGGIEIYTQFRMASNKQSVTVISVTINSDGNHSNIPSGYSDFYRLIKIVGYK